MDILNLKFDNEFDGIWACASLVHFNEVKVIKAIQEFAKALKVNGILYISLKNQKDGNNLDHKIINKEGTLGLCLKQNFELKNNIRSQSMYNNQNWISMIFLKLDSNLLEAK
jgi:SAM-dependent methyltransferase